MPPRSCSLDMATADERALEALERDGCCCLRRVLDDDAVDALREAAREVTARAPSGDADALHQLGVAYEHACFTDLATNGRMVALVARAMTPNLHVYEDWDACHVARADLPVAAPARDPAGHLRA